MNAVAGNRGNDDLGFAIDADFLGFAVIWQSLEAIEWELKELSETKRDYAHEAASTYHVERSPCDLARVSFGKPHYNHSPTEVCIFQPLCSPFWSVWVANISDGWATLLNRLCANGHFAAVSIRSSGADPANWIQELHFRKGAETVRYIRSMWDGRAKFYTQGNPLFCEELELYAARSVRARLTRPVLARYLLRLGLPVSLPGFWASCEDAIYFQHRYPVPSQD